MIQCRPWTLPHLAVVSASCSHTTSRRHLMSCKGVVDRELVETWNLALRTFSGPSLVAPKFISTESSTRKTLNKVNPESPTNIVLIKVVWSGGVYIIAIDYLDRTGHVRTCVVRLASGRTHEERNNEKVFWVWPMCMLLGSWHHIRWIDDGQWAYDSLDPIFLLLWRAILSSFSYFTYENKERKNKMEEPSPGTLSPFIIR
jgi:hypothetical protein